MTKTLVLSAAYEPISCIGFKSVFSLLRRDAVEVISEWDKVEPFLPGVAYPAVVRLKGFKIRQKSVTRHQAAAFSRNVLFVRDGFRCGYCGAELHAKELTVDHILPRHHGGKTSWENCTTCCQPCNSLKGNLLLSKSGLKLRRVPNLPTSRHFWTARLHAGLPPKEDWHADWYDYLSTSDS